MVALALGSNQGDRSALLRFGVEALGEVVERIRCASHHETSPISTIRQPDFLNTAVTGWTGLAADELLSVAKKIELAAGRRSGPRWGPRPLDVDLLLFGRRVIDQPGLEVPHPRLAERLFYLRPLSEIASSLRVPPRGKSIGELRAELEAFADPPPIP